MFSALCLIASAAMLYFVVRYRVHVTISYAKPARRRASSKKAKQATPALVPVLQPINTAVEDLTSALINLGCKPAQARKAAIRAAAVTDDFTAQITLAIGYAQKDRAA